MTRALLRRIATVALIAMPVAFGLALFFEACGAMHGAPKCGPLSYVAIPFVVLSLMLDTLVFSSPQNDLTVRIELWLVAYAVAVLLCILVLWLQSFAHRK